MPFALADLAPIIYALLALLLAVGIELVGKFMAQLIPDVPLIGSAIRDGITSGTAAAGSWLVGQAHASWTAARALITDAVWMDKYVTAGIVSVLSHLGDQASHVWSVLESSTSSLQTNIDHVVNVDIPNAVTSAYNGVEGDLKTAETSLQDNIDRVVDTTIPNAVTAGVNTVESDLKTAETNLQHNIDALSQDVTTGLASVWSAITPLQTAVNSTLPAAIATTAANAQAESQQVANNDAANLAAATSSLQGQLTTTTASLNASIANQASAQAALSAADLTTAEGQAQAAAASATIAAETEAQTELCAQVATLQSQIDQNTQQLQTLEATTTISLPALPDVTTPGTITVPVAVAALAGALAGVITEVDSCMVTTCDGPNNWQNLISAALNGADFAAILAFIAEAAKNPSAFASEFASVAEGIYNSGHSLIDDLLSL